MKWKRDQPGRYVSGQWVIEGSGTKWTLIYAGNKVGSAGSKKELQTVAEESEMEDESGNSKPRKRPPGKPVNKNPDTADLPSVVDQEKGTVSLDGALRSIRLTLDGLAYSNNSLASDLRRLADSNEEMAKAVRELIKFMASRGVKK